MLRRVIAFFGHAPGLWLVYREPLPKIVHKPNAIAVVLTLAAMLTAGLLASSGGKAIAVLIAWAIGHVAWGTYLALRLPPPSGAHSRDNASEP